MRTTNDLTKLEANASVVAKMLKLLANEQRACILFHLMAARGEVAVGTIATSTRIGQSALSQHLAKLRESGVIASRRVGHRFFYRIVDTKTILLLDALKDINR